MIRTCDCCPPDSGALEPIAFPIPENPPRPHFPEFITIAQPALRGAGSGSFRSDGCRSGGASGTGGAAEPVALDEAAIAITPLADPVPSISRLPPQALTPNEAGSVPKLRR